MSRSCRALSASFAVLLAACTTVPDAREFTATKAALPAELAGRPVIDARAGFRQAFCSIARQDGVEPGDATDCADLLWKLADEPPPDAARDATAPGRASLRWFVVTGALGDCFGPDATPFRSGMGRLTQYGERIDLIQVSGRSGTEHNARQIADALHGADLQPSDHIALLGYSKGAVDILQFLADYPEPAARIAAVVSVAGPILGSRLAARGEWAYRNFFAGTFAKRCDPGDAEILHSLIPETRKQWLADHPPPPHVRFFSLAAFTTREHLARGLLPTWRMLAATDSRNDGQVLIGDAIIPGSTLLGYVNADHWGLALTIENELPSIAAREDPRRYPQDQLLATIVRYVSEAMAGN